MMSPWEGVAAMVAIVVVAVVIVLVCVWIGRWIDRKEAQDRAAWGTGGKRHPEVGDRVTEEEWSGSMAETLRSSRSGLVLKMVRNGHSVSRPLRHYPPSTEAMHVRWDDGEMQWLPRDAFHRMPDRDDFVWAR